MKREPIQKRPRRKAAEEAWAHRDSPGEWSEEPVEIEVKPSRMEIVSFRLPTEELDVLQRAASQTGESLSEFVRFALAYRLGRVGSMNSIEVTSGVGQTTFQGSTMVTARRSWSEVPLVGKPEADKRFEQVLK